MRTTIIAAAALLAAGAAIPARAQVAPSELRCTVSGGIGLIVAGKRGITCVYYRRDGRVEFYIGFLGRLGLDLGPAQARQVAFSVVAPDPEPIATLEGDFVGAGGGVTLGRGAAGDGLMGGRAQAVMIVPLANSRLTGLNVNAGIGDLHLRYAGTESQKKRYRGRTPDDLD